jgi:hypothetical protein
MRRRTALLGGVLLLAQSAHSQIITTVAGTDFAFPAGNIAAVNAPLGTVSDVAVDHAGNVYIADPE